MSTAMTPDIDAFATLLFLVLPYIGACRDFVVVVVNHVICTLPVSGASRQCTAASPACFFLKIQMLLLLLHRSSCLESGQTFFNSGAENGRHTLFALLASRADIVCDSVG
ncbi:unnamed protein product [Polarella glacialis]|uniref:Uncharacterized protein n=1 Tax=Polarella glacialis TaxID=89957 RepID=A0A813F3E5_POLGL|nr:unnamed protein product [Polarella glacialis]